MASQQKKHKTHNTFLFLTVPHCIHAPILYELFCLSIVFQTKFASIMFHGCHCLQPQQQYSGPTAKMFCRFCRKVTAESGQKSKTLLQNVHNNFTYLISIFLILYCTRYSKVQQIHVPGKKQTSCAWLLLNYYETREKKKKSICITRRTNRHFLNAYGIVPYCTWHTAV